MGFQVLRVQKIKTAGGFKARLDHHFREKPTPNADPLKTPTNDLNGAMSTAEGLERLNALMPSKVRSNAVLGLEYLITTSKDDLGTWEKARQDAYFAKALAWLGKKHGAENIVCSGVHRDETTPHLTVFVIPKVEGKLNAKAFTGGSKALAEMQTAFYEGVAKDFGLERGLKGSRAKHVPIAKFYEAINQALPPEKAPSEIEKTKALGFKHGVRLPVLPEKGLFEGGSSFGSRVANEVLSTVAPKFNEEIKSLKSDLAVAQPKAQAYELFKSRERQLARLAKKLETRNTEQQKQDKALLDRGFEMGVSEGKKTLTADLNEAHATIKELNQYRQNLTQERDEVFKELSLEKEAHQKTKTSYASLVKEIAHAVPDRLAELRRWARDRLGLDKKQERGMSR